MKSRTKTAWMCPTCGRRFAKARQWHSCNPQSVEAHFAGKPASVRRLFDHLVARLKKLGPFRIDAVKTSINLISRHHFGGVMVRGSYLRVGFLSSARIESPRIVRTEVLGPSRVGHSVVVRSTDDIDRELLSWLAAARKLQA